MKKMYLVFAYLLLTLQLCAQAVIPINLEKSEIKWEGSTLFRLGGHYGTLQLKSGQLEFKNGVLSGGKFVADMNTIVNTDGEYSQDLIDHLKNEDFFEVDSFPKASLILTRVESKPNDSFLLRADLTIKGITNSIEIWNANKVGPSMYRAIFIIDRTKWNITYGSNSFFSNLGDNVISDAIKLDVLICL